MTDINANVSSRDIELEELKLYSASRPTGEDIRLMFDSFSIFEDIEMPVITGRIVIKDGINLYSTLGINGSEFLKITFKKPGSDDKIKYSKTFRIYAVTNRQPAENNLTQTYVLHFCSEELVFSNQQYITKAYKNKSANQHIVAILRDYLKAPNSKLLSTNFETSYGRTDFLFTIFRPVDAIKKLSEYAYSPNKSTFLFFENAQGFNFKSIESLLSSPPIADVNYSIAKLANEPKDAANQNLTDVNTFVFDSVFDVLKSTEKPEFAGTLYTLDLIRQKFSQKLINAYNAIPQQLRLDKSLSFGTAKNRNNKSVYEEYQNNIKYSLTNYGRTNVPYMIERNYRENNTNVEDVLLQRKIQLNALFSTRLKCVVPGNPAYTIGYTVNFNLPSFAHEDENGRTLDPFYSGKYLITKVRHTLTPKEGLQTAIELCKNSVVSKYQDPIYSKEYSDALRS
jgi:hypothetical protein